MTTPSAHSLTISDLLRLDPHHPDVRARLEQHYRAVCQMERALSQERALLADLLGVKRAQGVRNDVLDTEQRNRVG